MICRNNVKARGGGLELCHFAALLALIMATTSTSQSVLAIETASASTPGASGQAMKATTLSLSEHLAKEKSEKKPTTKPSIESKKKATASKQRSKTILVPPPPPSVPTMLAAPLGGMETGIPIQYLSKDDLLFRQKAVEKRLENARLELEEQEKGANEKVDRAERFVSLYQEGVVSRKELETSKVAAERSKRETELSKLKVEELERLSTSIEERLAELNPKKKVSAAKSKKSTK